jgi:hypothetical protein
MISEKAWKETAVWLGVETAALKAVAEVESGGKGFLPDGQPVILFEPHIFYRQLRERGYDVISLREKHPDIIYPTWGQRPYGKSSEQHGRLARAVQIDREAALYSASWGRFQIMGFNWAACNAASLQDFINLMYASEEGQLRLLAGFLRARGLVDALRKKDWTAFARGYNGAGYAKNQYHKKLAHAYQKYRL